jgi:hypothetical protein
VDRSVAGQHLNALTSCWTDSQSDTIFRLIIIITITIQASLNYKSTCYICWGAASKLDRQFFSYGRLVLEHVWKRRTDHGRCQRKSRFPTVDNVKGALVPFQLRYLPFNYTGPVPPVCDRSNSVNVVTVVTYAQKDRVSVPGTGRDAI